MKLNDLSGSAWAKLTKSVWATQSVVAQCKQTPLGFTNPTLFSHSTNRRKTMPVSDINENYVKLIELLTTKNQIVYDLYVDNDAIQKATLAANRQFLNASDLVNENSGCQKVNLLMAQLPVFKGGDNENDYGNYLDLIHDDINSDIGLLKSGGHIAFIVTDVRIKSHYYDVHTDITMIVKHLGFTLQGIITLIEENQRLKTYGYPTTFVPNIINQTIVIAKNNH